MKDLLRVTEIISPFTGIEFIPEKYLIPASQRGTLVHKFIESFLNGNEVFVFPTEAKPYMSSFRKFWDKHGKIFDDAKITLERRLNCEIHGITGQIDVILEKDGKTYLIDWKTSAKEHHYWCLQGAAYKYLCEVNGYQNVQKPLFVKINKDKQADVYKYGDCDFNLETFFKCLDIFKFFNMNTTRVKK